jgi:hypothetical protein
MRREKIALVAALSFLLFFNILPVFAQSYLFSVDREVVHVYWESNGTARIEYLFDFTNRPGGHPIDFVDVGMPNSSYDLYSVTATVNGNSVSHIAPSEYVSPGVEIGLGSRAISPGQSGTVRISVGQVENVLYDDSSDPEYASAVFSPTWFDKEFVLGGTDLTVVFHLPPGIQPDEPRWHESPAGWPYDAPYTDLDADGRVRYTWQNETANAYTQYIFGASFPREYVPAETVQRPSVSQQLGVDEEALTAILCCGGVAVFVIGIVFLAVYSARRRKLRYLPPKLSIEGHGIKRGLTAVEAAVMLETPLDRVLTMILFSLIKKGAARVVSEDPLKIERLEAPEAKIRPYEEAFLAAIIDEPGGKRRSALQKVMVELVKAVQNKMKGFSLKETQDYYRSIMKKAWRQIEAAETPQVRSERFEESLEWTMLDRDFDERTERTFRTGPVYIPHWWWLYRPSYSGPRPATSTGPSVAPSAGPSGRGMTLPSLPGADFAASLVNGVQDTAAKLVSNVVSFTDGVTKVTNPPPPPSRSSGVGRSSSGGCACACACACAGCACACAGGGR